MTKSIFPEVSSFIAEKSHLFHSHYLSIKKCLFLLLVIFTSLSSGFTHQLSPRAFLTPLPSKPTEQALSICLGLLGCGAQIVEDASTCCLFFSYSPWGCFCNLRSSDLKMYQLNSVRANSFSTVLHMLNLFSIIIVTSSQAVSDPHDGNMGQRSPDQSQMNFCHSWQQPARQKLWIPEGILRAYGLWAGDWHRE